MYIIIMMDIVEKQLYNKRCWILHTTYTRNDDALLLVEQLSQCHFAPSLVPGCMPTQVKWYHSLQVSQSTISSPRS